MKFFGTNGIRGIINESLDSEFSLHVGHAIAEVLGPGPVAMACDPRPSSDMIKCAVSAGLMSMGVDVLDLGMVPTPALQLYVRNNPNVTGGMMITASHNPPEFNGIKCISADGTECSKEEESRIENLIERPPELPSWRSVGHLRRIDGVAEEYIDSVVSAVDHDAILSANLTVCLDCSNGSGCVTSPSIMKRLGVRAITLNGDPQGEFPGHPSEPTPDNLADLARLVVDTGADLGIAHDGDADRCVFITEKGEYVDGNCALALLARMMLEKKGGGLIVTPVATSKVVDDVTESNGGRIIHTAVGSPVVARRMMKDGGIFGGEENGGLIFSDHQYCRDGGMGAARMLELIAIKGKLSLMLSELPEYHTIKKAYPCPEVLKSKVLDIFSKMIENGSLDTTDGLRIDFDDGWVILRPSGTEPKFRVYAESQSRDVAERLSEEFGEKLTGIISDMEAGS